MGVCVEFLVPTFGRYPHRGHLLEELLYWYLRQEGPRDRYLLTLLNDAPGQELFTSAPGVRVVNLGVRLPSIGVKRNLLCDLAVGEYLLVQDDDDIPLPGRANQAVAMLGCDYDYWSPGQRWLEWGRLSSDHAANCAHHASAYRRSAGLRYRDLATGEDIEFEHDARRTARVRHAVLENPRDWQYVYRWGVSDSHLSGHGDNAAAAWKGRPAEPGRFEIVPRMRTDYEAVTRAHLAATGK